MVPVVSVVIPVRRGDGVPADLRAALATDVAVGEVVVVADTGDGPGAARQRGCEQAACEVVLLLDADVIPGPGLAAGHAAHHASRDGLVVAGPMPVANPHGAPARLYAEAYARWQEAVERDPAELLRRLWAGNISLRRDDAIRVGIASPAMSGLRHEDRELGLRLAAAGLTPLFDPSLRAEHRLLRGLAGFRADCRAEGVGLVALHRLHPELGPVHLHRAARALGRTGVANALAVIVGLHGPLIAARLLRRAEIARGMAAAGG